MRDEITFIKFVLPHAIEAIGKQHGWLVTWAVAKAGVECNWNVDNVLIARANNCLGIKGGVFEDGKWLVFDVPVVWVDDSTADGRDDGRVPWRRFDNLSQCFGELVKMWNDREPYQSWRNKTLAGFEQVYSDNTPGHAEDVLRSQHDVLAAMRDQGWCDKKGRIQKYV